MGTVSLSQDGQARSVQVYFGEMKMVGVLIRMDSNGGKPKDLILFIHMFDFSDEPFSLGDWVDYLPVGSIDSVEMIPSTSFTCPD